MSSADLKPYFSEICTGKCKGICCDPWWGIISYTAVKGGGIANLGSFRAQLLKGIKERAARIVDAYITKENPPRYLFGPPERYNVSIRDIKAAGSTVTLSILAVFAFRCKYLSDSKACAIHPAVLGGGDIRPAHCAMLGSPGAMPGEKGYCRIIHAAGAGVSNYEEAAVDAAIRTEKSVGAKYYENGVSSAEEAADGLIRDFTQYCQALPGLEAPKERVSLGRNDPCHCGSGIKFKKCHGR